MADEIPKPQRPEVQKSHSVEDRYTWKDGIGLIGPMLIFLGVLKLYIYYSAFGLSIIRFLDFGEIVTSFLDVAVMTFAMIIVLQVLYRALNVKAEATPPLPDSFFKRVRQDTENWLYVPYMLLLYVVMYYAFGLDVPFSWTTILLFAFFPIITSTMRREIVYRNRREKWAPNEVQLISILYNVMLLILIVAWSGYAEADQVKNKAYNAGIQVHIDENTILWSNENYFYIGQTNGYVFMYSKLRRETDVIPTARVRGFVFVNQRIPRYKK